MATFETLLASCEQDVNQFGVKTGALWEKACLYFLRNQPDYKDKFVNVWSGQDFPYTPSQDIGIDAVAEDIFGKFWAIQDKNYNEKYAITKEGLNSFISAANTVFYVDKTPRTFEGLIVMATTNAISPNGKDTLTNQYLSISEVEGQFKVQKKEYQLILLDDFKNADFHWPDSFDAPEPEQIKKSITPYRHQSEAIAAVIEEFKTHDRANITMACRSGKSFVYTWVAEQLGAKTILQLVPSLNLVRQMMADRRKSASIPYTSIAVCSDQGISSSSPSDLEDKAGTPVIEDIHEIASFANTQGVKVIFCTYHSAFKIAEAQKAYLFGIDLIISDEFHNQCGEILDKTGRKVALFDEHIKANKRLFASATPKFFTENIGKQLADNNIEYSSADLEEYFGRNVFNYTFVQAKNDKVIREIKIMLTAVHEESLYSDIAVRSNLIFQFIKDKVIDAKTAAAVVGLYDSMEKLGITKVLTFHNSIAKAEQFAKVFAEFSKEMGDAVKTDYLDGTMNTFERYQRFNMLDSKKDPSRCLITNCDVVTEGVTLPDIGMVAFIDATRSTVRAAQGASRTLGLNGKDQYGYIYLPVFVEEEQSIEKAVASGRFKPVMDTLAALSEFDDTLKEIVNELTLNLGRERIGRLVDSGVLTINVIGGKEVSLNKFTELLSHRFISSTSYRHHLIAEHIYNHFKANNEKHIPVDYYVEGLGLLFLYLNNTRAGRIPGLAKILNEYIENDPSFWWENPDETMIGRKVQYTVDYIAKHGKIYGQRHTHPILGNIGQWWNNVKVRGDKLSLQLIEEAGLSSYLQTNIKEEQQESAKRDAQAIAAIFATTFKFPIKSDPLGTKLDNARHGTSKALQIELDKISEHTLLPWNWYAKWKAEHLAKEAYEFYKKTGLNPSKSIKDTIFNESLGNFMGNSKRKTANGISSNKSGEEALDAYTDWDWRNTPSYDARKNRT